MIEMFNIFKKKKDLKAICNGKCIPLESVNDDVFSSKMMGDGIAIIPTSTTVVSPAKGKVTMIMEASKHALSILSEDGLELLIHIGLDSVKLNGEGFKLLIKVDEEVNVNTPLIEFDAKLLKENNIDSTIMLIITNDVEIKKACIDEDVIAGESVIVQY